MFLEDTVFLLLFCFAVGFFPYHRVSEVSPSQTRSLETNMLWSEMYGDRGATSLSESASQCAHTLQFTDAVFVTSNYSLLVSSPACKAIHQFKVRV